MGMIYYFLSNVLKVNSHKTLSDKYFEKLLCESGFNIISIEYYGYMPRFGPFFPRTSAFLVPWIENVANFIHAPKFLAQSCIIVCRKF
jgi:hypothetical protein